MKKLVTVLFILLSLSLQANSKYFPYTSNSNDPIIADLKKNARAIAR